MENPSDSSTSSAQSLEVRVLPPRAISALWVVPVLLVGISTAFDTSEAPQPQASSMQQRVERCPNEPYRANDGEYRHAMSEVPILLARVTQHIPEYHDCQRLLVRNVESRQLEYGPLVGIWARDDLDKLSANAFATSPVAVAELYNFSTTSYTALGIGPGYSCLYLHRARTGYTATLLYLDRDPTCPRWANNLPYPATSLEVKVQRNTKGEAPPAARWDMDPRASIQYMGIWCPDGWCEIGVPGFYASKEYSGRKEIRVKGWYDEQHLAVIDGTTGRLRPSSIRGRTIPSPNLRRLVEEDFECKFGCIFGGWVRVATVIIESDSADYYLNKLNLRPNVPSHVFLRFNKLANKWQSKIEHPQGGARRQMIRIDHNNPNIPGTSRWHFMGMDETVWVRCSDGCCDVTGLQ